MPARLSGVLLGRPPGLEFELWPLLRIWIMELGISIKPPLEQHTMSVYAYMHRRSM